MPAPESPVVALSAPHRMLGGEIVWLLRVQRPATRTPVWLLAFERGDGDGGRRVLEIRHPKLAGGALASPAFVPHSDDRPPVFGQRDVPVKDPGRVAAAVWLAKNPEARCASRKDGERQHRSITRKDSIEAGRLERLKRPCRVLARANLPDGAHLVRIRLSNERYGETILRVRPDNSVDLLGWVSVSRCISENAIRMDGPALRAIADADTPGLAALLVDIHDNAHSLMRDLDADMVWREMLAGRGPELPASRPALPSPAATPKPAATVQTPVAPAPPSPADGLVRLTLEVPAEEADRIRQRAERARQRHTAKRALAEVPAATPKPPSAGAPDPEAVARDRLAVIAPLAALPSSGRKLVEEAATRLGLTPARVYMLLADYRADPRQESLMPKRAGRPRGLRLLHPAVEARIADALAAYVATTPRPSLRSVVERVRTECRENGLPPPDRTAFERRLAAMEEAQKNAR